MPKVSKNVDFKLVRAFYTTEEVRQDYGIYANFSGKVVVDGVDLVALNDLSLRVSRDGVSYIGSQSRQIDRGYIHAIAFFPKGSMSTEEHEIEQQKRADKFIADLSEEINQFIADAQKRLEERISQPRPVPNTIAKLAGMKPQTPRGKKSSRNTEDVPF